MDKLTRQDKNFVKELVITGNKRQSANKAYKYKSVNVAGVMANRKLRNTNIINAINEIKLSLAERISTDKLEEVLREGLQAGRETENGIVPDYAVRHKYFDSAVKIVGGYAPDKNINVNINATTFSDEEKENLLGLLGK